MRLTVENVTTGFLCIFSIIACSVYGDQVAKYVSGKKDAADSGGGTKESTREEEAVTGSGGTGANQSGGNSGEISSGGKSGNNGSEEVCGDGRVSKTEKCDIAIPNGSAGACPKQCPAPEGCVAYVLKGSGCSAQCEVTSPECKNGDNCCPPDCSSLNDSDCSAHCGDGIVQADAGETCEPVGPAIKEGPADAASSLCPTQCDDDGNPCTEERLSGSAKNCNAVCDHIPITTVANGDGCCPTGANANSDSDCKPVCGNGVQEADEECDGTVDCNTECKSSLTVDQRNCVKNYNYANAGEACDVCMCTYCRTSFVGCYGSDNETLNADCAKIVACGYENNCTGSICYCGDTALDPYGLCLGTPNGPCKKIIEGADGTADIVAIFYMQMDLTTASGRARVVGDCFNLQCRDVCYRN